MKPRRLLRLSALALLPALLATYLLLPRGGTTAHERSDGHDAVRTAAETTTPAARPPVAAAHDNAAQSKSSAAAMRHDANDRRQDNGSAANSAATESPAVQADAALSLADALQRGDARSPPIAHDSPPQEAATPAELADPVAYRRYENRQQARLYRAYEREAAIALGDMQRDLQRARAQNLPPELIAEGEEKARMLQQTLEAVRNGEMR